MSKRFQSFMLGSVSVGLFSHSGFGVDGSGAEPWPLLVAPAGIAITPPVSVVPSDTGIAAMTSLSAWRDYNARNLAQKTEQLAAPSLMTMPRPPQTSLPLDVWTRVSVDGLGDSSNQSTNVVAGAEYKVSPKSTFGIATLLTDSAPDSGSASVPGEAFTAYANLQVLPGLTVKAESNPGQNPANGFAEAGADQPVLAITPRFSHTFSLEGGQRIQPFVVLKNTFDHEVSIDAGSVSSAGAGFVIDAPSSYSFSISTTVEPTGHSDGGPAAGGRMQLTIPMP
jgi:hypothetical protein